MYRVKQLFGGSLTLRDYDAQVAEALAMVRALNRMTNLGVNYWADKGCSLLDARGVTRRVNPAADGFDLVRWPAFEHSWYILNDEVTPPLNYIRII